MSESFSTCPKCGSQVEVGLGFMLVTCAQCGNNFSPLMASESPQNNEFQPQTFEFSQGDNVQPPPPPEANEVIEEIVAFGNQAEPIPSQYGTVVTVKIEGIDSPEIRNEISNTLSSPRFGINSTNVMKSMVGGMITIPDLNPVKATVLINSIKSLPCKISWNTRQLAKASVFLLFWLSSISFGGSWARHEINLNGYAIKIKNGYGQLQSLMAQRESSHSNTEKEALAKEITKKYKEISDAYNQYRKEQAHIRFEHPEQGDETERKYRHLKMKTMDEIENEGGVDGTLSRIKREVDVKFLDKTFEEKVEVPEEQHLVKKSAPGFKPKRKKKVHKPEDAEPKKEGHGEESSGHH